MAGEGDWRRPGRAARGACAVTSCVSEMSAESLEEAEAMTILPRRSASARLKNAAEAECNRKQRLAEQNMVWNI